MKFQSSFLPRFVHFSSGLLLCNNTIFLFCILPSTLVPMNSNLSREHMQSCDTHVNLRKGSTYIPLLHSEHTPVPLLYLFTLSIIKGNILYVFNSGGPARYKYFLFFIPQLPQDMYFMINFMIWRAGALATLTEDMGLIPSINITAPSCLLTPVHVI